MENNGFMFTIRQKPKCRTTDFPRDAPAPVITEVRLEPKREETDCTAHEHDLVAGSLSGIYGSKKRLLV